MHTDAERLRGTQKDAASDAENDAGAKVMMSVMMKDASFLQASFLSLVNFCFSLQLNDM